MKGIFRNFKAILYRACFMGLVLSLLLLIAAPVSAAPLLEEEVIAVDGLDQLMALLLSLSGFGALIAAAVNIGKQVGFVKDGDAGKWSAGANLLGLIVLFVLGIFQVPVDLLAIDEQLLSFAKIAVVIFEYIIQLFGSKIFHKIFSWFEVPLIGKSFSK